MVDGKDTLVGVAWASVPHLLHTRTHNTPHLRTRQPGATGIRPSSCAQPSLQGNTMNPHATDKNYPPIPPTPKAPPPPAPIKLPPVKPVPFTATVALPKGRSK